MSTPELHWFKSSYSYSSSGNDCVEAAPTIHLRDSKQASGPRLALTPQAWTAFVASSTVLEQAVTVNR